MKNNLIILNINQIIHENEIEQDMEIDTNIINDERNVFDYAPDNIMFSNMVLFQLQIYLMNTRVYTYVYTFIYIVNGVIGYNLQQIQLKEYGQRM